VALEEEELLCTIISNTSTSMPILFKFSYYKFSPALEIDQTVLKGLSSEICLAGSGII
jgi:hypothetical protein